MADQWCEEKVTVTDELVQSQEDQLEIHRSTRQIEQSAVVQITSSSQS